MTDKIVIQGLNQLVHGDVFFLKNILFDGRQAIGTVGSPHNDPTGTDIIAGTAIYQVFAAFHAALDQQRKVWAMDHFAMQLMLNYG